MKGRSSRTASLCRLGSACACAALFTGACSQPTIGPNLESDVPQERLMGLAQAMRDHDESAIPQYVIMLRSDDPAVRMFGIAALQDLTGETFGYDFGAPEVDRSASIDQWEQWLRTRESSMKAEGTAGT